MAEFPAVSPLLDGFTIGECFSSHDGVSCYALRHEASAQEFVLKHISVPASEAKVQALLLSGAYADTDAINSYFKRVADGYAEEFALSKSFADCPNILHYLAHQVVAKEGTPGFDVYAVSDRSVSLKAYTADNAMTKLHAVNLGIDLCAALCALRDAGYLHQDVKPENVFVDGSRFLLGDLGLTALQDMNYTSLPEQYISAYTAPELHDMMAGQNATTDIYAVGMLLYRIYNGDHAPFEDERITSKEADRMRISGKELPVPMYADYELAEILMKACAFKQEDRYQSPAEMKQALEQYMQRNAIEDTLIVPPIVSDPEPEVFDEVSEEAADNTAPVRFADVDAMDEDFIKHFAPDTAALDAAIEEMKQEDAKEAAKAEAQKSAEAEAEEAPVTEEASEEAADESASEEDRLIEDVTALLAAENAEETEKEDTEAAAEDTEAPAQVEEAPAENAAECSSEETSDAPSLTSTDELPEEKPQTEDGSLTMVEDERTAGKSGRHHWAHHAQAAAAAERKQAAKKHAIRNTVLGCILVLLIAAIFVYFFTPLGQKIYHYTISIEQFETLEVTTNSVSVRLVSNVEQPPLTLSCKDAYGNSIPAALDGQYAEFTGLESGTAYTITAELSEDAGLHRLSGTTSVTAATLPSTEILDMTASAGTEEGEVVLDLVVKDGDPTPASWTVSYCCEGASASERSFSGEEHRFVISGLEVEKEYTFTLVSSDLFKLTGETSVTYTTEKAVTAEGFSMVNFVDGVLSVRWDCTSEPPEIWTLTCTDAEGNAQTVESTQCTASFEGLTLGTAYTVKLQARGLFIPLTVEIPASLIHIDKLTATAAEDGIHVFWSSASAPEGTEWILLCIPDGDTSVAVAHNTASAGLVLTDLLPNTVYTLEVKTSGDSTVVGHNTLNYAVAKPEHFDSRGVAEASTTVTTYALPEKENWKAKELTAAKKEFTAGDTVAYKILARTGRYQGSFSLLYLVRDENGVPVDYGTAQHVWNEVWAWDNGGYYSMAGTLKAPDRNGTFTLELYFSYDLDGFIQYKRVAVSEAFTVSGAAEQ